MTESQHEVFHFANAVTIVLQQAVITGGDTDVIANLTVSDLNLTENCSLTEYIAPEILQAIQHECKSKAPTGLEIGEYVVTNVGRGFEHCFVYHLACWTETEESLDYQEYVRLLGECLQAASDMGKFSLVLPITEIKAFGNQQDDTDHDLANRILDTYNELAACSEFKLRNVIFNVSPTRDDLHKLYKEILRSKQDEKYNRQNSIPTREVVSAISRNSSSTAASMEYSGALNVTKKTTGSISQSVNSTGNGAKSMAPFDGHHYKDVRPKDKSLFPNNHNSGENAMNSQDDTKMEQIIFRNGIIIKVYKGDITNVPVDGIVHGSNYIDNRIDLTDAVGKALKEAGGAEFERECHIGGSITDSRKLATTRAGKMKYRRVYHINTSLCNTADVWQKMIFDCLDAANKVPLASIAFPPLKIANQDATEAAKHFTRAIDVFSKKNMVHIKEIHIVAFDDTVCSTFCKVMNSDIQTIDQSVEKVFPSRLTDSKFTISYKGVNITVKEGIFTDENMECVVHGYFVAATLYPVQISLNDEIGRLLLQQGGTNLKGICDSEFIKKNGLQFTDGGGVCKEVLHIDISSVKSSGYFTWEKFAYECLSESDFRRLKSIAFPVFIKDYIETQASQQITGVKNFIDHTTSSTIKDIVFVVDNGALMKSYTGLMQNTLGDKPPGNKHNAHTHPPMVPKGTSGVKIEVLEGDITKDTSDMIVHGTRGSYGGCIPLSGKLGSALKKAGGSKFVGDCSVNNVPSKGFVVTMAGDMKCRFVLHADISTIQYTDRDVWKKVTHDILNEAERRSLKSIAFPAMGMVGLTGSSPAARQLVAYFREAITEFELSNHTYLRHIKFLIYDNTSLTKIYKEILLGETTSNRDGAATKPPTEHVVQLAGGIIGELDITIVRGDLTKETTECIVHATGNPISFSGQSGKALKVAGGPEFEKACKAVSFNTFGNTNTVLTRAGSLPCNKVLHLAMPSWSFNNKLTILTDCILECLNVANDEKITSISFPALGTGQWSCKPAEVAKCFETAINKFNNSRTKGYINDIRLIVFEQSMMDEFTDKLTFSSSV